MRMELIFFSTFETMIEVYDDNYFMDQALNEANKAYENGEIPVGAVVVMNESIIGRGYNQTEQLQDFTAHAEMIAITSATQSLGNKYLKDAVLYVTLEPCAMCASAAFWSQISKLVYGAEDPKRGYAQFQPALLNKKTKIVRGLKKQDCGLLLQEFFKSRR